ncbi:MAG: C10 family peptidase [Planctomycetota bacterium]|jgi:hypothetical protein
MGRWNKSIPVIAFFLLVLQLFCGSSWAGPTTSEQAGRAVRGWLKANANPLSTTVGRKIGDIETFTDEGGNASYYIVYLEPAGFVVVPAEDLVEPIICFADDGSYDSSDDNPLGALVSSDVPGRVATAKELARGNVSKQLPNLAALQARAANANNKWQELSAAAEDAIEPLGLSTVSEVWVAPFVQSKWGQSNVECYSNTESCYNYYTPPGPDGSNTNYPCGCVATATAQLMRYYEYPGSYVWSNMPLEPLTGTPEYQRQEIGRLCYDVAEAVSTTYGSGGSMGYLRYADTKLVDVFTYSNSIYAQDPILGSTLSNMVNTNLDAKQPTVLGIKGGVGGHAVVCDGYGYSSSTLYHHLNMGWCGMDDAWYNLPTVNSTPSFNILEECVYNVYMSGSGEIISGRVTDLVGNPIPDVVVTATGGGTYQGTSDAAGIYAIVKVPSGQSFTVSAAKAPYIFSNQVATTGTSTDLSSSSGNKWGIDFVSQNEGPPTAFGQSGSAVSGTTKTLTLIATDDGLPNPPGQLSYKISTLPDHGRLTDPGGGAIISVPYTLFGNGNVVEYWPCTYFAGEDSFCFKANDGGISPTGGDSAPATVTLNVDNHIYTTYEPQTNSYAYWPIHTYYHDCRTQVIYLSSDVGDAQTITDLALDIYQVPGQTLNNWTIRMKHTSKSDYSGPSPWFETSGWTDVYQNNESISSTGWQNFHLQSPFEYNGTSNLLIDFSHNNSFYSSDGHCMVSDTGNERVMLAFCDSTHGDPLYWDDFYNPGLYVATAVPNLKLIGEIPSEPIAGDIEPDCDVDFGDFAILGLAWLTVDGEPGYNSDCDISEPADDSIDWSDVKILTDNWLARIE